MPSSLASGEMQKFECDHRDLKRRSGLAKEIKLMFTAEDESIYRYRYIDQTLTLIYLTRFTDKKADLWKEQDFQAWKNYDWNTIDELGGGGAGKF